MWCRHKSTILGMIKMSDYNKILVGVDFSSIGDTVASRAFELASRSNAQLTFLHVVEYLPPFLADEPIASPYWVINEQELVEQAKNNLKKFAQKYSVAPECQLVEVGTAKTELCRIAEEQQMDLIVVGSYGRHGLGLLLGSTANGVLHHAPCDVLAVRVKPK